MKKLTFATLSFIILFAAQQVAATNDHANEHANNNPGTSIHEANENEHVNTTNSSPIVTTSPSIDNDQDDFKNHGDYVSSIAHEHEGGSVVSVAAKSDIGKHHDENNDGDEDDGVLIPSVSPTDTPSVTPTDTPSVTPSESVTPTESPSVTPTDSITPTDTPTETVTPTPTEAQTLGAGLKDFLDKLKELISNFTSTLHF